MPRRLKAMHFMTPCSKYSSITSGKSPCSGSLHKKHIYTKNYYNFKTKFQAKIKNILERERERESGDSPIMGAFMVLIIVFQSQGFWFWEFRERERDVCVWVFFRSRKGEGKWETKQKNPKAARTRFLCYLGISKCLWVWSGVLDRLIEILTPSNLATF